MSDGVKRVDAARKSAILDRWERANAMVDALCQPRGMAGSREWLMSIPARPDHDPDLIISSALADVPALLDALAQAEVENARLRQLAEAGMATAAHAWGRNVSSGYREAVRALAAITALGEAAPATREE